MGTEIFKMASLSCRVWFLPSSSSSPQWVGTCKLLGAARDRHRDGDEEEKEGILPGALPSRPLAFHQPLNGGTFPPSQGPHVSPSCPDHVAVLQQGTILQNSASYSSWTLIFISLSGALIMCLWLFFQISRKEGLIHAIHVRSLSSLTNCVQRWRPLWLLASPPSSILDGEEELLVMRGLDRLLTMSRAIWNSSGRANQEIWKIRKKIHIHNCTHIHPHTHTYTHSSLGKA